MINVIRYLLQCQNLQHIIIGIHHGDPTIKVGATTCIYCRKEFKSKYNVKLHHNICKIKNGGMTLLFDEVIKLKEQNKQLQLAFNNIRPQNIIIDNSVINNSITNHINTVFNFNLINFGDGVLIDWTLLRTKILQKIYMYLYDTKVTRHYDNLKIMNYLFVLGNGGKCDLIKPLTSDETNYVYKKIGVQLSFDNIIQ